MGRVVLSDGARRIGTPGFNRVRELGRRLTAYARRAYLRLVDREKGRQLSLMEASGLLDPKWYLSEYPDVSRAGADVALHYLDFGARELRDPGPAFSTSWYCSAYPEALRSGINPLVHYVQHGRKEGLSPVRPRKKAPWWEIAIGEESRDRKGATTGASVLERLKVRSSSAVVVIPYSAEDDPVARCLASLRAAGDLAVRTLVVFEELVTPAAKALRASDILPGVEFHPSRGASGFVGALETAAVIAEEADILLLDPRGVVAPGWARNMRVAAYCGDDAGMSVAMEGSATGSDLSAARAVAQLSAREYPALAPDAPAALYLRRSCLDGAGVSAASRSEGECSDLKDFIERAIGAGWRCVLDDATVVFRDEEQRAGVAIPGALEDAKAVSRIKARAERARQVAAASPSSVKPRVLFVLSTRQGGTPQTNRDLMASLADRLECFVLHSNASTVSISFFDGDALVELEKKMLAVPIEAFPHRSQAYDELLADWLTRFAIDLVHVRHIAWHGLGLVGAAKALGIPVVFSFHDFYAVCPTVKLLDENSIYCGGTCTATPGECHADLWEGGTLPPLKNAGIGEWQENFGRMLDGCDAFVTTSERAREVISGTFPFLQEKNFSVIPHGRDFERMESACAPADPAESLRVLLLGGISVAKGGRFLEELARLAPAERLEIHVLGTAGEDIVLPPHVIVHGPYLREDVVQRIAAIRPHVGAVLSIWPETYCHTLTELWAAGIPVIGFDIGAVGERIKESEAGWLVPMSGPALLDMLRSIRSHPEQQAQKLGHVAAWQKRAAAESTCRAMSDAYFRIYRRLAPGIAAEEVS